MQTPLPPGVLYVQGYPAGQASQAVSSLTDVIARRVVEERIFPKNYFKGIVIGTSSEARKQEYARVFRQGLPRLLVAPRWSENEEPFFDPVEAYGWSGRVLLPLDQHYMKVLDSRQDGGRGLLTCAPRRLTMNYDVAVMVNTPIAAQDVRGWMLGKIDFARPFYYDGAVIYSPVPAALVEAWGADLGLNPATEAGRAALRDAVRRMSRMTADLQVRAATGRQEWMWGMRANVLVSPSSPPEIQLNKKGSVDADQVIRFGLKAECWAPFAFHLAIQGGPDDFFHSDPGGVEPHQVLVEDSPREGSAAIVTIGIGEVPWTRALPDGKAMVDYVAFTTDTNTMIENVSLAGYLDPAVEAAGRLLARRGEDPGATLRCVLWRSGGQEVEQEVPGAEDAWTLDWVDMQLTLRRPMYNWAYMLVIYADPGEVNRLAAESDPIGPFADDLHRPGGPEDVPLP